MPASVADPVSLVLRTTLSGKKGPFPSSHDGENSSELLEDRLAASAKRVLLSTIEYEPAPKQQVVSLDSLKSKYTVLNSSQLTKNSSLNGLNPITTSELLPPPKVTLFRSEDVKVGWKSNVPIGAGMINMGNTCYMNSTLQALFHVPSLCNWLLSKRHCKNCDSNGSQNICVVCMIAKTLQATHEKSGSVAKPVLIYNRLKFICKHMVHGRQEDAHEFMRYLVEAMEKSYLQSVGGMKLDSRSKETNPLGQIFGGYIRTEVTCLKCKHTSTTFQHFQDIPLDIQHASTLDDALGHYFRRERLEGDNAYKCEKCKSKVPATKKFSIERAPNVLCIQLKRFGLMGGKMSKHIQFQRSLSLNRFLFSQQPGTCSTYKFVSLINHMGPSQHCGHYTAIAEASNGQLYVFDDCSVRLISQNMALTTGAYVLIYEKVQSSTVSSSPSHNGVIKATNGHHTPTVASLPSKVIAPRPALITEPSRPKINFELKKAEPVNGQQKPRLVIRNGTGLFKASGSNGSSTPSVSAVPTTSSFITVKTEPTTPKPPPPKMPTTLVPYDGESSDEELEEEKKTAPISPILKATEAKWQVSSSPTPLDTVPANGTVNNNKWRVSDNGVHQDGSSSGSSTASNNSGSSKWVVRSLSDTETERASTAADHNESKVYHSDSDLDPTSKKKIDSHAAVSSKKVTDKLPLFSKKKVVDLKTESTAITSDVSPKVEESDLPIPSVELTETIPFSNPEAPTVVPPATIDSKLTDNLPAEKHVKCNGTKSKWDGSRKNDTVKELLRMSHSGFGDHVRTWDGGKSHLTKQVEEDKRSQRKRTADELLDEELDKGKIKKIKTKEESVSESSPTPSSNGYNPFQVFQDSVRNRDQQPQHRSYPFKKDQYHNHNRYGYQGRGGGKSHRGRGGGSDHHYNRSQSKNQSWRRR